MGTEIGRDLGDCNRYNLLKVSGICGEWTCGEWMCGEWMCGEWTMW